MRGSEASRPAYLIAGKRLLLEVLYPSAMSPARSTATLGMKRSVESGLCVAACVVFDATLPPVTSTW